MSSNFGRRGSQFISILSTLETRSNGFVLGASTCKQDLLQKSIALMKKGSKNLPPSRPFLLLVKNDLLSTMCIFGCQQLKLNPILVPKSREKLIPTIQKAVGNLPVLEAQGQSAVVTALSQFQLKDIEFSVQNEGSCDNTGADRAEWFKENDQVRDFGAVGLLTSGSTGAPKVILNTWKAMRLEGQTTNEYVLPEGLCRVVCASSIAHAYAINLLFSWINRSSAENTRSMELHIASNGAEAAQILQQDFKGESILYGTPGTYVQLIDSKPEKKLHLDYAYSAGIAIPAYLKRQMKRDYGIRVLQNYGCTECGTIATERRHSSELCLEHGISVGKPFPGVQVRVEPIDSADKSPIGKLHVRTPWQHLGHLERGKLITLDTPFHSVGDYGYASEPTPGEIELVVTGRNRPLIKKVFKGLSTHFNPEEVEEALRSHPNIIDALIPMDCPADNIVALIVLASDITATEATVLEWIEEIVPEACRPDCVCLVEFLPCSPAGKLIYTMPKRMRFHPSETDVSSK